MVSQNIFFSKEECDELVTLCENVGYNQTCKINAVNPWDILRIHDTKLKEKVLKRYKEVFLNTTLFPFDLNKITTDEVYLSLTRYYDGRFLEMHRDISVELTTVIVLTNEYSDGRFVLSEDELYIENKSPDESLLYTINQGYGLTFNGGDIYHGVMPVTTGIRKSLNVWINSSSFKIQVGNTDVLVKTNKTFV